MALFTACICQFGKRFDLFVPLVSSTVSNTAFFIDDLMLLLLIMIVIKVRFRNQKSDHWQFLLLSTNRNRLDYRSEDGSNLANQLNHKWQ